MIYERKLHPLAHFILRFSSDGSSIIQVRAISMDGARISDTGRGESDGEEGEIQHRKRHNQDDIQEGSLGKGGSITDGIKTTEIAWYCPRGEGKKSGFAIAGRHRRTGNKMVPTREARDAQDVKKKSHTSRVDAWCLTRTIYFCRWA